MRTLADDTQGSGITLYICVSLELTAFLGGHAGWQWSIGSVYVKRTDQDRHLWGVGKAHTAKQTAPDREQQLTGECLSGLFIQLGRRVSVPTWQCNDL